MVLFKVKWYILLLQGDGMIVIDHENRFVMISTTRYEISVGRNLVGLRLGRPPLVGVGIG